jgi:hypothetical protein
MTSNVPNLDALDQGELMQFWMQHQLGRNAKQLFPNGGLGTRIVTAKLANYASNKATAMSLRMRGEIATAVIYEGIADTVYRQLPDWARW